MISVMAISAMENKRKKRDMLDIGQCPTRLVVLFSDGNHECILRSCNYHAAIKLFTKSHNNT